ncbi:MAG TPA: outer membrane beta-barrel protein [Gammaproteobacteria bacterium]|jgi:hypothetical protein
MNVNKKTLLTAAVAAALGLPLAAQADTTTTSNTYSSESNDPNSTWWSAGYFELDGGQAHYGSKNNQVNSNTANSVSNFSDNDTGWRANLGYQFNPWFSLELSYVDFGSVDDTIDFGTPSNSSFKSSRKAHGYGVAGVGSIPFGDSGWSGFLRLGTIDAHTQVNDTSIGSVPVPASNTDSNDWKAYYGVGVAWQFAQNWGLRLGWDQYHDLADANTGGQTNINFANIGLQVRF